MAKLLSPMKINKLKSFKIIDEKVNNLCIVQKRICVTCSCIS